MTAKNVEGLTERVMDVLRQAYYETRDESVQRLIVSALLAVNDLRLAVSSPARPHCSS